VMRNASDRAEKLMAVTFYFWNPIFKKSLFWHSRRVCEMLSATILLTVTFSLLPNVQSDSEPAFQRLESFTVSNELKAQHSIQLNLRKQQQIITTQRYCRARE
jgi:hypothetical protein